MIDVPTFLNNIRSDDADARFAAWRAAGEVAPSAIPRLGELAASDEPGVAKAASEALATMVHSVGKDPKAKNRADVVKGMLGLTASKYALPVRVHAYRLLSNIAPVDSVAAIAAEIGNPELREEVVYCLERIPGDESIDALLSAYESAADEFKPRILAAFGHRRAAKAVDVCVEAARSTNTDLAVAGFKAFGRIGHKPESPPDHLEFSQFSGWQKIDVMDSLLRYADGQVEAGNIDEALHVYDMALSQDEVHWQCAAIIGIAKIGTPEAATKIFPKLKSSNSTTRITAEQAWHRMAEGKG